MDKRVLTLVRIVAWILVAAIVAITLVPIGLRPVVTADPGIERAAAYALTFLLLTFGYPRRWPWILLAAVLLAGGLEAGQTLTGTRHGRVDDFLVKAASAVAGGLVGIVLAAWTARRLPARAGG